MTATHTDVFRVGGELPVRRIGLGTMQLTGPGHWSRPADPEEAKALLRRAVELGVNHIDTADAYGPHTAENLIRKALHPYADDLVIATKGGMTRHGPNQWAPLGRPEYLRQCVGMSLRRLQLEQIPLYYLHRVDPQVPLADQLGVLADMRDEGKIRFIGVSKVTLTQFKQAREITPIAAVQNRFNPYEGEISVLNECTTSGTAFVPYSPLRQGRVLKSGWPAPQALAYLLDLSPVTLPIPGTASIAHLEENLSTSSSLGTGSCT
ncbi:aldo/keto reductase [Saccharopolyspora sp. NPDC000359]|uniref:aldo/keto reductase n=1 Tax=Saccharopolyspora sp. NPDC000359 TaxID=3154251 RepID=UPI003323A5CB